MPSDQFKHYLGQKVLVSETKTVLHLPALGMDQEFMEYAISDDDTVIFQLSKEAAAEGLELRTWLPDTFGTTEVCHYRLNVHVSKQDDGTFEITQINVG